MAGETAGPSTTLRSGRDDNSVVAGIDATEQCPTPATELSSRPERSAVEGPAVSPLPTHNSNLSHPSPLVIPTGAKRSGGICSAPCDSLKSLPGRVPGERIPTQTPHPTRFRNAWSQLSSVRLTQPKRRTLTAVRRRPPRVLCRPSPSSSPCCSPDPPQKHHSKAH